MKKLIIAATLFSCLGNSLSSICYSVEPSALIKKSQDLCIKNQVNNYFSLVSQIKKYIDAERLTEADELIKKALCNYNISNQEIYELKIKLYLKSNQLDNAEKAINGIFQLNRNSKNAYLLLGEVFLAKAKEQDDESIKNEFLRKAFNCYKKVYTNFPVDPLPYLGLGQIYYEKQEYEKALGSFMIAKDLDKTNSETLFLIGDFHLKRGNYTTALKYLRDAVKYEKNPNYETHFLLGNLYEKLADIDKARNEYKTVLKIKPGDDNVLVRYKYIEDL